MKKKLIVTIVVILLVLTIMPITSSQNIIKENNEKILHNNKGFSFFCYIYIELDPKATQSEEILDNFHNKTPRNFLTNIDIIVPNPNQGSNHDLMISPFRTVIGELFGGGAFFKSITPEKTTTIHVILFWGSIEKNLPNAPNKLVVDGLSPLLRWEY